MRPAPITPTPIGPSRMTSADGAAARRGMTRPLVFCVGVEQPAVGGGGVVVVVVVVVGAVGGVVLARCGWGGRWSECGGLGRGGVLWGSDLSKRQDGWRVASLLDRSVRCR